MPHLELDGFMDHGSTIRGELEFASSFRCDGRIEGVIRSSSELTVGEAGFIEGRIEVARARIIGEVQGTIHATERVVLDKKARVCGEISSPVLSMEEGACFDGDLFIGRRARGRGQGSGSSG